ncbi:HNH endonuclease [Paenibacillus alvei]|uniref:HNH endonuclease n=1 Tax=Paenibacillus alvei TaxID=44250 RepID=A0ABT4EGU5_PAEAL|nr:HNH endonuclease [Paenibacillus alvei]MCY9532965.1 HNH endonuclease [Paenibacillus alvei]
MITDVKTCVRCGGSSPEVKFAGTHRSCNRCRAQENPDKQREYQRKYRERVRKEKPNHHRDRVRRYRKENPHLSFYTTSRYLAKKEGVYSDLTQDDALDIHNLPDVCSYCGKERKPSDGKRTFHNDHIIPMVQGGFNTRWNITKVCISCNSSKGSDSLIGFRERNEKFTADRYESVVAKMVELSGLTRENIDLLLEQSYEFELLHRKQREKLTSILSELSIAS